MFYALKRPGVSIPAAGCERVEGAWLSSAWLVKGGLNSDTMFMIEPTYLSHQFLIAMPTLADPNFFQTVTYISEHNANGALGLVINRPLNLTLSQLLEHLNLSSDRPEIAQIPVYHGGPVQPEQGFVLHNPVGHWDATLHVTDDIGITTSRDILQAWRVAKVQRIYWSPWATRVGDPVNWNRSWPTMPGYRAPSISTFCSIRPVTGAGWPPPPCWASI